MHFVDVTDFNIVLHGVRIGQISIPEDYISIEWAPNTRDHIVQDGNFIKDGQVVALADPIGRGNIEKLTDEYLERNPGWKGLTHHDRADIDTTSRWAIVTGSSVKDGILRFRALYADGTIRPRSYNVSWLWAIRKNVETLPVNQISSGITYDLHFLEHFIHKGMNEDSLKKVAFDVAKISGLILGEPSNSNSENSAAGESGEKSSYENSIVRYNFKKKLRDADSLRKVSEILKDRDAFIRANADEDPLSNPEKMTRIPAKRICVGDVFFIAGSTYRVQSVSILEEYADSVFVDAVRLETKKEISVEFDLDQVVSIVSRGA